MGALSGFVHAVDRLNEGVGRLAAWFTLATVLICAVVVVLRYAFSIGFVWMQELYVWTYACVFMLGAGYTLLHEGHVRVDIFYAGAKPRTRAIVNLFGAIAFLLPWIALTAWTSLPYVRASWRLGEEFGPIVRDAGCLPPQVAAPRVLPAPGASGPGARRAQHSDARRRRCPRRDARD